jgi:hypothetical protein
VDVPAVDESAISEAASGGLEVSDVGEAEAAGEAEAYEETEVGVDSGAVDATAEDGADLEVGTVESAAETGDVVAAVAASDTVDTAVVDGVDLPVAERVRRQVATLDGLAALPLSEHAQRYDEVHAELQAALTEIDGESS